MKKWIFSLLTAVTVLFLPIMASANMVWPSLYIEETLLSPYIIGAGLVIEFLFIKFFLKFSLKKSVLADLGMNICSTLIGIAAIPISGIVAEIILIPLRNGTFDISHWIASYIFAVLCNVLIEGLFLKIAFKLNFKKNFLWLTAANALSVVLAAVFMRPY